MNLEKTEENLKKVGRSCIEEYDALKLKRDFAL